MNELVSLPKGMRNLTGAIINGLKIVSYAGTNQYRWNVECRKCGTTATELHTALVNGAARCRFERCSLNRLDEPKALSKHEHWLNSAESEKPPVTAPVPVTPAPEHVSDEYRQYRRHAVIEWGYTSGDGRLIEYSDWQQLPEFAKDKMMEKVNGI